MSLQGSERPDEVHDISDVHLARSTPEKEKVAIGIHMTADEQMRRDYGPLKKFHWCYFP